MRPGEKGREPYGRIFAFAPCRMRSDPSESSVGNQASLANEALPYERADGNKSGIHLAFDAQFSSAPGCRAGGWPYVDFSREGFYRCVAEVPVILTQRGSFALRSASILLASPRAVMVATARFLCRKFLAVVAPASLHFVQGRLCRHRKTGRVSPERRRHELSTRRCA